MSHFDVAMSRLRAGLCVLPARADSKRPALAGWKLYQDRLPTENELALWFRTDAPMCIVTGNVSDNLEMIDFDAGGEAFDTWCELVTCESPELVSRLIIEQTPSGGRHVIYRCPAGVTTNLKVACRRIIVPNAEPIHLHSKSMRPRKVGDHFEVLVTLIETRGEGGLFLCDPSPDYRLIQGQFEHIPEVSDAERDLMLQAAWSLDELPGLVAKPSTSEPCGRPGDDFNERGDVRSILQRHGWTCVRPGENEYWRRPGKESGWSATLKSNVLFVFSANAAPFEPNRAYSPFGVLALLEHDGDFVNAATALRTQGFGQHPDNDPNVDISRIAKPALPHSQLIARRICDVEREQLSWLWPGRIPLGKLTLLAGDPGLGKSLVSLDLAARVSRGMPWPDLPLVEQPIGEVLLFSAEDDVGDTISHRLDHAGADDTKIVAIEGVQVSGSIGDQPKRMYFSLEHHLPQLEQALAEWPNVRLVVVDPISAYCGQTDSHNNAEVRALLAPLAELAGRHRTAILAVTHLSKSSGTKALYRAMGSLAFAAASRAVWAIVKDPDDPARRLFLPAKLNLAVDPDGLAYRIVEGKVAWENEPVKMHADDAFRAEMEGPSKPERHTQRDDAEDWLRAYLADGAKPSKQIIDDAKENGISERTLRRAFQELGGRPRKDGEAGCWRWGLPDQVDQQDGHAPLTQEVGQVGNLGDVAES